MKRPTKKEKKNVQYGVDIMGHTPGACLYRNPDGLGESLTAEEFGGELCWESQVGWQITASSALWWLLKAKFHYAVWPDSVMEFGFKLCDLHLSARTVLVSRASSLGGKTIGKSRRRRTAASIFLLLWVRKYAQFSAEIISQPPLFLHGMLFLSVAVSTIERQCSREDAFLHHSRHTVAPPIDWLIDWVTFNVIYPLKAF